jgi:hypothetical protein
MLNHNDSLKVTESVKAVRNHNVNQIIAWINSPPQYSHTLQRRPDFIETYQMSIFWWTCFQTITSNGPWKIRSPLGDLMFLCLGGQNRHGKYNTMMVHEMTGPLARRLVCNMANKSVLPIYEMAILRNVISNPSTSFAGCTRLKKWLSDLDLSRIIQINLISFDLGCFLTKRRWFIQIHILWSNSIGMWSSWVVLRNILAWFVSVVTFLALRYCPVLDILIKIPTRLHWAFVMLCVYIIPQMSRCKWSLKRRETGFFGKLCGSIKRVAIRMRLNELHWLFRFAKKPNKALGATLTVR